MSKKKIVLFRGNLDTLNLFSRQLMKGLSQVGNYEFFVFDLEDNVTSLAGLYTFLQGEPVTAMIGFNSTFYGMKLPSGGNLCESLQIPCINILVDHPYWYRDILKKMPSTGIVLCVDRGHMNYINRFYPQIAINGFLPHGGTCMEGVPKPLMKRCYDVIYAGSLYADYIERQKPDFTGWRFAAEDICEETIADLLENPAKTIESGLEENLRRHGVLLSEEELAEFISSCVYIERVVSSHFREKILKTVAEAGIPLHLYGAGWERCKWINLPNVHYGGMISPGKVLRKMEESKIVLNTLPWFRDGSHERVFNGMLRGALVCSETSGYLKEVLPSAVWEPFGLSSGEIAALPERMGFFLENPAQMQQMATAGYELACREHTWQKRAGELHGDLLELL